MNLTPSVYDDVDRARVTLLHSGSDCLNPALLHLPSFVHTTSKSTLLISQWMYYLNPPLVLLLEMLTGIEVSYMRDFKVGELLAAGRHVIVTPGTPLENIMPGISSQTIDLTKYQYWEMIRAEQKVEMETIVIYGGLRRLWYRTSKFKSLRTWMSKRGLPTANVLFPRFPSVLDPFYVYHFPFRGAKAIAEDICDQVCTERPIEKNLVIVRAHQKVKEKKLTSDNLYK
jgi:hypothetical protein